jgi:hypothetical protein
MSGRPPPRSVRAAALGARREGLAVQARAGGGRDATGRQLATLAQRAIAQQDDHLPAGLQHTASLVHAGVVDPACQRVGGSARGLRRGGQLLEVHRNHQGGDLSRSGHRRRHALDRVLPEGVRGRHGPIPAGHGARERLDVRGERRVVLEVPAGVVADDVEDRRARAARVVQVRQPIGQAGPEVQQGERRFRQHAAVPVGSARANPLEQSEDRAQADRCVERTDEWHLGGAGVGEADVGARRCCRLQDCGGAVGCGIGGKGRRHAGFSCGSCGDHNPDMRE